MKSTVLYGKLVSNGKWEAITDVTDDIGMVNQLFRTIKDAKYDKPENKKYTDLIQYFSNGRAKIKSLDKVTEEFEIVKSEEPKMKAADRVKINLKKLIPKLKKLEKQANERAEVPAQERVNKVLAAKKSKK